MFSSHDWVGVAGVEQALLSGLGEMLSFKLTPAVE